MKKKLTSVLLVLIMIISCIACGMKPEKEHFIVYSDIDFGEPPTTVTYLTIGDKPTNGQTEIVIDELNKILTEKVNAKLDIYYVGWDEYLKKYNNVLSSGNVELDLIGTSTDWLDAWPNVFAGNFMPLSDEMLKAFCPNTYRNVTDEQWDVCSYNGNVYFIPENEYSQWTNHGIIYRKDIAKEAGIRKISDWNELDKYVRYVAEKKPEMIAWDADGTNTAITLGYLMSVTKYIPIYEISTYGLWGADSRDLKTIYSPYYEGNELLDFAVMMKEWNDIGVWRDGLFSLGDNTEEFYEGISAMTQHHTQKYYTDIKPEMETRNPGKEVDFYWFGKDNANLVRNSICHGAMAVYAHSRHPEKALMVYDLLRNDKECYRLLRYGIEGTQYVMTEDGMIERPSGYNTNRDSIVTNFWWGRRDVLELQDTSYSWNDYYELLDEYDHVVVDYPWDGVTIQSENIAKKLKKIIEICDEYIPEITYGQYDCTPQEEVSRFRAELKKAGFEQVTQHIQSVVDSY